MNGHWRVYLATGQVKTFDAQCDCVCADGQFVRFSNNENRKKVLAYVPANNILWIEWVNDKE